MTALEKIAARKAELIVEYNPELGLSINEWLTIKLIEAEERANELALIYKFLDDHKEEILMYKDGNRIAVEAYVNGRRQYANGATLKEAIENFYQELEGKE